MFGWVGASVSDVCRGNIKESQVENSDEKIMERKNTLHDLH